MKILKLYSKSILFYLFVIVSILLNCKYSTKKLNVPDEQLGIVSEFEKEGNNIGQRDCIFLDPDTSIAGIKIRDAKSVLNVLGHKTNLVLDSTQIFYSNDKKQILTMTIHPGESANQVSVFSILYATNFKEKFRLIETPEFITEKGIKLGISKSEIIDRLGTCYLAKDSSSNSILLEYKLELPNDSKTGFLARNQMPIYFANYRLTNGYLEGFEFGFENP
ncbi:MAG: hypothetical protein IPO62_11635 [Saprospiraceae bacterium]|nr:hypothetical protein [Saprospiraceae bacterium]